MRRALFRFVLLAALPLTLSACTQAQALDIRSVVWSAKSYTVATLDLKRDTLRLYWKNPLTHQPFLQFSTLKSYLASRNETLLFATNSGIYTPEYAPLGLHIAGGRVLSKLNNARSGGNFALRPNGVFWVRGDQAGILETDAYKKSGLKPNYAAQSGPLLVINGQLHPAFNASSSSLKLRSGVGVCQGGAVRFAISAAPVNFDTFARFFRDALKCSNALYLDGSISAFYAPQLGDGQFVNFAGMWGVTTAR